jgi:hypothetical protein
MLADPHSKKRPRDINEYTGNELDAALALLTVDNADNKKKRKQPEYWSDSDNDDWPKYDHKNEHPYDPTIKVPTEQRNVINLQQTANETKKQPTSNRLRPSGNVPVTSMERLDHAIASRKNKPRGWSIGGRKRSQRKRSVKQSGKRRPRKTKRKTRRRKNKRTRKQRGSSGKPSNNQLSLGVVPNLYVPKDSQNQYKVEDKNAPSGTLGNMAQIRGRHPNTRTPTLNTVTGKFE